MWIRSQSRKALLNVNQVVIIPSVDKRMYFICNSLEKESVTLGVYLTEEKALKVLDRIEELIENQCGLCLQMRKLKHDRRRFRRSYRKAFR